MLYVKNNNFIIHSLHMLKLIMQVLPEQDNQAKSATLMPKRWTSRNFCYCYLLSRFCSSLNFFTVPFLMPDDNTCQGNTLFPNVHDALFVSREGCLLLLTQEVNVGFCNMTREQTCISCILFI